MNKISMLLVVIVAASVLSACKSGAPGGGATTDTSAQSSASGSGDLATRGTAETSQKADEPQIDYMRRDIDVNIKDGNDALQKKDYDRAEKIFLVALNQCDLYIGQEARQAAILNNLAAIYEEKEMYLQAVPLLTKAQKLFIRAFGRKSQAVYITLGNLGRVLAKQHRWEEAANVYQTAVGLMEEDAKVVKSESYREMLDKCGEAWEKAGNAFKANKINAKIKALKAPAK
ncbi:tetratricopeptide repeat protein [Candidatus Obscuribacterales bacterium]|nr:tetratricopeptide repeat protein [Candidatus Obscuribacterales bacterium]